VNEIITKYNKENTINRKSQCHSSSNKPKYRKSVLATILENNTPTETVADSAATGHFFPNQNNRSNKHKEIEVVCANNETMVSVATTELDIPELSSKAKTAYCFNEMKQPLLSIPLLADNGCKISLTANNIIVTKNNKTILKGIRDTVSTLWMIPIKHHKKALLLAQDLPSVPVLHAANSAYHQPTIAKLMAFHNATIGSIPVVTLCNAIDNDWLTSFPGLTSKAIRKHLPKSISTTMGQGTHISRDCVLASLVLVLVGHHWPSSLDSQDATIDIVSSLIIGKESNKCKDKAGKVHWKKNVKKCQCEIYK
jgi:hypothetical protein